MLGKFALLSPGGGEVALPSPRMQVLVATLALAGGKPVARSRLWDLLWEDRGEEQARSSLRQAFTGLRKAFAGEGEAPFRITSKEAAIDPAMMAVDAAALAGDGGGEAEIPRFGEFLEGIQISGVELQRWLAAERQRLRGQYADMMTARIAAREAAGRLADARDCAEALLGVEPASETAHRLLMRMYLAEGDRVRALRQYGLCREALAEEFSIEPDSQTDALYQDIRIPDTAGGAARDAAPSVVVLPFEDLSGTLEQRGFCDSLTASVTAELSRFHDLFVIASHSALAYKGKGLGVPEICGQLGVRYAVSGDVQQMGGQVRVHAQLADGADGRMLWAERYDRDAGNMLALQDEITETIVGTLATAYGGQLRKAWQKDRRSAATADIEAFDCFTRAVEIMDCWTPEGVAEGRQLLLQAVKMDPDYSKAWAKLAWTYLVDSSEGWSEDVDASIAAAVDAAHRALECDSGEAWAVWVLAGCHIYRGEVDRGIAEFERAIDLNPNDADILMDYAYYLSFAGRSAEGLAAAERAMQLNPHFPDWYLLALLQVLFDARNYAEAVECASRLRTIRTPLFWLLLGASHAALGAEGDARRAIREALALDPDSTVEKWSDPRLLPYRNPENLEHLQGLLKKAGLKS